MSLSPSEKGSFYASTLLSEAADFEEYDHMPVLPKILRKDLTH